MSESTDFVQLKKRSEVLGSSITLTSERGTRTEVEEEPRTWGSGGVSPLLVPGDQS